MCLGKYTSHPYPSSEPAKIEENGVVKPDNIFIIATADLGGCDTSVGNPGDMVGERKENGWEC